MRSRRAFTTKQALGSALAIGMLGVIGCTATLATPPEDDAAAEERLYLDRYARAEQARGDYTQIYDMLVDLPGAPKPSPLPRASSASFSAAALSEAVDYARNANSAALIIVRNGEVELAEYFNGAGPDSLMVSKSLAKPFGVLAVGRAIAQGHIDGLDQPTGEFFVEWAKTPKAEILVRHLLDMRTGLERQRPYTSPEDVMRRAYLHPRHTEIIINEYPLTYTPGQRYDYSNANSELVAPLIERAVGRDYETFVSEALLQPLGAAGGEIWLNRDDGVAHAGCCALLPAETWVRLAMLVLDDGVWGQQRLLPEGFVEEMTTPTPQNPYAGMGLYIGRDYVEYRGAGNPDVEGRTAYHSAPYAADDLVLFDGNSNQVVYIVPSQNLVIARLGDSPPADAPWDNAYLPNLLLNDLAAAQDPPS